MVVFPVSLFGQSRDLLDSLFRESHAVVVARMKQDEGCIAFTSRSECPSYCRVDSIIWIKGIFPVQWELQHSKTEFEIEYKTWPGPEWKYNRKELKFRKGRTYLFFLRMNQINKGNTPFTLVREWTSAYAYSGKIRKWIQRRSIESPAAQL